MRVPASLRRMVKKKVTRPTGPLAGLGERLRAAREHADVTQEDAAAELQTSTRSVRRIENGEFEPSMWQLATLARLYEVTTDALLYGTKTRAA